MNTDKVYKKYKLLKDLPKSKAGSIFAWNENMKAYTNDESIWMHQYEVFGKLEDNDWFSEIKEENKSNDSFQWTDGLAMEYCNFYKHATINNLYEFKRSHTPKPQADNKPDFIVGKTYTMVNKPQPQKEEQGSHVKITIGDDDYFSHKDVYDKLRSMPKFAKPEEQRIEVDGFIEKVYGGYKFHAQYDYSQYEIPEEKFPAIKQAIEQVLNDDKLFGDRPIFTPRQVDSMCEDTWDAARAKAHASHNIEVYKYEDFEDYKNSKQKQ